MRKTRLLAIMAIMLCTVMALCFVGSAANNTITVVGKQDDFGVIEGSVGSTYTFTTFGNVKMAYDSHLASVSTDDTIPISFAREYDFRARNYILAAGGSDPDNAKYFRAHPDSDGKFKLTVEAEGVIVLIFTAPDCNNRYITIKA